MWQSKCHSSYHCSVSLIFCLMNHTGRGGLQNKDGRGRCNRSSPRLLYSSSGGRSSKTNAHAHQRHRSWPSGLLPAQGSDGQANCGPLKRFSFLSCQRFGGARNPAKPEATLSPTTPTIGKDLKRASNTTSLGQDDGGPRR